MNMPRRTAFLFLLAGLLLIAPLTASAHDPDPVIGLRSNLLGPPATSALQDTSRLPEDHSPRGALWRSIVLPGWGQWYNRQYYKIPIVYLGLGGLVVATLNYHSDYVTHRRALLYEFDNEEYAHFEPAYHELEMYFSQGRDDLVRERRDVMRRNRDLLILATGAWWALATLEAYVSAHLLDFDIDEDLSLAIEPHSGGMTARLKIGL